jgi:hypothetical protein
MARSAFTQQQCRNCGGYIKTSVRSGNTRCSLCRHAQWVPSNPEWEGPYDSHAEHPALYREAVPVVCHACGHRWQSRAADQTTLRCPGCRHSVRVPTRARVAAGYRPDVEHRPNSASRRVRQYTVPNGWDHQRMVGFLHELPLDEWYGWTVDRRYRRGLAQLAKQAAQADGVRIQTRWLTADPLPDGAERMQLAIKRMAPKRPRVPRPPSDRHEVPFASPSRVAAPPLPAVGTGRRTPGRPVQAKRSVALPTYGATSSRVGVSTRHVQGMPTVAPSATAMVAMMLHRLGKPYAPVPEPSPSRPPAVEPAFIRAGQCEVRTCTLSHTRILCDGRKVCTTHAREAGQ